MAQSMKKVTKKTEDNVLTNEVVEVSETKQEEVTETKEIKKTVKEVKKPREFKDTDPVKCVSIVAGELGMIGIKSRINYRWAGRGDVTEVEYQDLVAAIRSSKKHIYKPYFIITDDEFLAQFPLVEKVYSSMFSFKDLNEVLLLPANQMKQAILSLPEGARESIKNIASSAIKNGSLDSVARIKVLDEIFDTKFMLMTELFG